MPETARPAWPENWPVCRLRTPQGDTAVVSQHGAQLLSWRTADGIEQLYLSPTIDWQAVLQGRCAIRGGIPLCWPQFNRRGALPKHGLARLLPWQAVAHTGNSLTLRLALANVPARWLHDARGQVLWRHDFAIDLQVRLAQQALSLQLYVRNTGADILPFTVAFHGYLAVASIAHSRVHGAQGLQYWDATPHAAPSHPVQQGDILFSGELDRVYPAFAATLQDTTRKLRLQQSANLEQTVVWNPGADLCAQLPDLPADGYQRFVCIEAAQIDTPVSLAPGEVWQGWQRFQAG